MNVTVKVNTVNVKVVRKSLFDKKKIRLASSFRPYRRSATLEHNSPFFLLSSITVQFPKLNFSYVQA